MPELYQLLFEADRGKTSNLEPVPGSLHRLDGFISDKECHTRRRGKRRHYPFCRFGFSHLSFGIGRLVDQAFRIAARASGTRHLYGRSEDAAAFRYSTGVSFSPVRHRFNRLRYPSLGSSFDGRVSGWKAKSFLEAVS